jgi:predicted transglutaminase-like cysteine proteinase
MFPIVRVLFLTFIFVLGFLLTAWASVGLPRQELSASTQKQAQSRPPSPQPIIKKPQRIDRAGINSADALMDLDIAPPRGLNIFDASEIAFDTPAAFVGKIESLQRYLQKSRIAFGQVALSEDPENDTPFYQWQTFLKQTAYLASKGKIEAVQAFVNRTPYYHDSDSVGSGDVWKDPEDFLTFGGDSEDFALTKYISFRVLGIIPERLRIAVVFDQDKTLYRAVLLIYSNTDVLVLDETKNDISITQDLPHLAPVYSFNEHHIWYHWKKNTRPPTTFLQTDMQKQYPVFP